MRERGEDNSSEECMGIKVDGETTDKARVDWSHAWNGPVWKENGWKASACTAGNAEAINPQVECQPRHKNVPIGHGHL